MSNDQEAYQEWRSKVQRALLLYSERLMITDFEKPGGGGEEVINWKDLFEEGLNPEEAADRAVKAREDLSHQPISGKRQKK